MKNPNAVLHSELDKLIELLVRESPSEWKPNPFTSEFEHNKRKKAEIAASFEKYQERVSHGYEVLLRHEPTADKLFDKKQVHRLLSKSVKDLEHETETLQELLHIKDESLLKMYKVVKKLHEKTLNNDASDLLLFLILMNPLISSFWEALGGLERQKANFNEACLAYMMAYDLNNESFTPLFSCMDMFLQQQEKKKAKLLHDYILEHSKLMHKKDVHQKALGYSSFN